MNADDEAERHRLTEMLDAVDAGLPAASPLREAVGKSAVALWMALREGRQREIESADAQRGADLAANEQNRLRRLGIDPLEE